MMRLTWKHLWAVVAAMLALAACAPTAQVELPGPRTQPAAPKVLTMAETREPAVIHGFVGGGASASSGGMAGALAHTLLTETDAYAVEHDGLAEVPSVENGTWRINPDGTMDLTWILKPGIKWQDGIPFTSEDLMFTLVLNKDRDLPTPQSSVARKMESATNPDPQTFIVHWSQIDVLANSPRGLTPMPRHLLEELYRSDKVAFQNSPLFRDGFIGVGPYRVTTWQPGSHIELARFDDYFQGRPPLDRVIVQFIPDQNTLLAAIQAGAIDAIVPRSLDLELALQLKRRWEGTGHLVRIEPWPHMVYLELMWRPEYARPLHGLPNLTVRQALSHAIDRASLAEVATGGQGPLADSWYDPTDPIRSQLESFIVKYPYDPSRAQQLLAQAGWLRGSDGTLVHTSRERYETEVWVNTTTGPGESTGPIIVDNWKAVGVSASLFNIPESRSDDREFQSSHPGPLATQGNTGSLTERYDGREVPTAANRWTGRNRAGYSNPQADALLDELKVTVDPRRRIPLLQQQVSIFTSDVVLMPLFWAPGNTVARKGVKADIHPNAPDFRVYLWDKE